MEGRECVLELESPLEADGCSSDMISGELSSVGRGCGFNISHQAVSREREPQDKSA